MKVPATLAAGLLAISLAVTAIAGDKPPREAKPLSEIVQILERAGYGPFSEIEFDDGRWEVKVWRDNRKFELKVDPRSGEILSERRD